jgi:hypothetical protein
MLRWLSSQITRNRLSLLALAAVGLASAQVPASQQPSSEGSLFSADERTQIVGYWADPNRYKKSVPDSAKEKGLWQVRLTPDGSLWLWNYNKVRKVSAPPTQDAAPATGEQEVWEAWLLKKLRYDRWQAWQTAGEANKQILGPDFAGKPDKGITDEEPERPGPEPVSMFAVAGSPPVLAKAVVPMEHTITFDDATIQYTDNVRMSNPRYAYYRFADGVNSEGAGISTVAPDRVARLFQLAGCTDSEARVMKAVSPLEGGFDAVNTYDTGFVSVGFIQFASLKGGAGSLGSLLLAYKQDDPTDFGNDFHKYGVDVAPNGELDVLDPATGAEVFAADANSSIIADKRLVAVFQRAGLKSDAFCAEQIKSAKAQFYPANDLVTLNCPDGLTLTGKVSDFVKSEAGLAMLFDRKVNTGSILALSRIAIQVAAEHHCTEITDLCHYEREIVASLKYRTDFSLDSTLSQPTN